MPVIKLLESLPQSAYSATQVLENESIAAQQYGIDMYDLMEKAGQAVFSHIREYNPELSNLFILAGKGNNGGDGFIVARLAFESGMNVTVYFCGEREQLHGDAKIAFEHLQKTNVTILYQSELRLDNAFFNDNHYEVIVDALFGIGYSGKLSETFCHVIDIVNSSKLPVFSIDVPSGLNATSGHVETTAIVAHQTVTFIVAKAGLFSGQAAKHVGQIYLATLSLGELFHQLVISPIHIQGENALPIKPLRSEVSHKGHIGLLLAIGGNKGLPGAIRLAGEAALRSGAALVAVCCHNDNHHLVLNGRPELMLAPDDADKLADSPFFEKTKVLLLGPGLGQSAWSKLLVDTVLQSNKKMVVDADALQILARSPVKRDNWVLTPHPGEAAKLLNCSVADIEKDRFSAAQSIVNIYGGICVLKGAGTIIVSENKVTINTSGNSGMASGGMGDVLSGIIAALLMQMPNSYDATCLAVYLHGQAADIIATENGMIGMLASDLFPYIQQLLNEKETHLYE